MLTGNLVLSKMHTLNRADTCGIHLVEGWQDKNTGESFEIGSCFEGGLKWKRRLSSYLNCSLINDGKCDKSNYEILFNKSLFTEAILHIYTSSYFLKESIYEDESRWRESYTNLLYNCSDNETLKNICDSLLSLGIVDGLYPYWEKGLDALSPESLEIFESKVLNNNYILSELIACYHNNGMFAFRDRLLNVLENRDFPPTEKLHKLFDQATIDYFLFFEEIYGGM